LGGVTIGFGLDLAGFSRPSGTVLVELRSNGLHAKAAILQDSPFSSRSRGAFADRLKAENDTLAKLLKLGNVAVDVPIELQGLPLSDAIEQWQLTLRPVDRALGGLPPLASWLGACVARFGAIIRESQNLLGIRLFETYPAASLEKLFGQISCVQNYKLANKEKKETAISARKELAEKLNIQCETPLSHDELDAIICAMTAVAPTDTLLPLSQYELPEQSELAAGFRLLKKNPFSKIRVARCAYREALNIYENK